jgi:hypothetical protein
MGKKTINPLLEVKNNKIMNLINSYSFANPLRQNLIAEWKFEGNANDTSGNGHNGTFSSPEPTLVTGKVGQCYSFSNSYISTTLNKTTLSTNFSICLWLNLNGQISKGIISFANAYNSNAPWILLAESITTTSVRWFINGSYRVTQTLNPANIWYYITLTYDGTTWKMYNNGVFETSYAGPLGSIASNSFFIGSGYQSGFVGLIDEVRIFNKVLSLTEINQVMNWS